MADRESLERKAIGRYVAMAGYQERELTPTMLRFSSETHHLVVIEDEQGWMTVTARPRFTSDVTHRLRFEKKHGNGAVWTFRDAQRLDFLAVEPAMQLQPGAIA